MPRLYIIAGPKLARERIKQRVKDGGHDVPFEMDPYLILGFYLITPARNRLR